MIQGNLLGLAEYAGNLFDQSPESPAQITKRRGPHIGGNLPKVRSIYCPHEILTGPSKIKVVGQTVQTGEHTQTDKRTDGRTDGRTLPSTLSPSLRGR